MGSTGAKNSAAAEAKRRRLNQSDALTGRRKNGPAKFGARDDPDGSELTPEQLELQQVVTAAHHRLIGGVHDLTEIVGRSRQRADVSIAVAGKAMTEKEGDICLKAVNGAEKAPSVAQDAGFEVVFRVVRDQADLNQYAADREAAMAEQGFTS